MKNIAKLLLLALFVFSFCAITTAQITSSLGNSFCEGRTTTLTAPGNATDTYLWIERWGINAPDTLFATGRTIDVTPIEPPVVTGPRTVTYTVKNLTAGTTSATNPAISLTDCCYVLAGANNDNFSVSKICNSLTVDGNDLEPEWNVSPWAIVDKVSHTEAGVTKPIAGQCRMLYDDDYVYVYIRVFDDNQPYNSYWTAADDYEPLGYQGDAVEIYIEGNCGSRPVQLGLTYPTTGVIPGKYVNQGCGTLLANYEAKVKLWNSTNKYRRYYS
jgi:hypothetical protein